MLWILHYSYILQGLLIVTLFNLFKYVTLVHVRKSAQSLVPADV